MRTADILPTLREGISTRRNLQTSGVNGEMNRGGTTGTTVEFAPIDRVDSARSRCENVPAT
jgi:hypothetical protein